MEEDKALIHSASIVNLSAALVKASQVFETAKMTSTNPFFRSKYADLGSVKDAAAAGLKANELTVSQFPDNLDGRPALTTMLIHSSGEWIAATYPLIVSQKDENAQGFGSATTYARRYGLSAVLGIIADEDDDGNAASKPPAKPAPAAPKTAPAGEAPRKTLGQYVMDCKTSLQACKIPEDITAWLQAHAEELDKLKVSNPAVYKGIETDIQARKAELDK